MFEESTSTPKGEYIGNFTLCQEKNLKKRQGAKRTARNWMRGIQMT